jgi:hypothetical protein
MCLFLGRINGFGVQGHFLGFRSCSDRFFRGFFYNIIKMVQLVLKRRLVPLLCCLCLNKLVVVCRISRNRCFCWRLLHTLHPLTLQCKAHLYTSSIDKPLSLSFNSCLTFACNKQPDNDQLQRPDCTSEWLRHCLQAHHVHFHTSNLLQTMHLDVLGWQQAGTTA